MEGLRAAAVAHHEVAAGVLGVDHGAVQADRAAARVRHLSLVPVDAFTFQEGSSAFIYKSTSLVIMVVVPVVGQQPILQDKPTLLVSFDVVGPLIKPALGLRRFLLGLLGLCVRHDCGDLVMLCSD